ncbi:hypothetical protein PACTADRAFT_49641 [Pachysolen tannophilus NRRL Y-2460]|uniref:Mid2 domain-containing protein n=1 Tax=Pachysolen tannophilus NRRL Y-2460 TaxID=669874 RepID=A0A1E4TWX9_PACTA|nr:hypothetical protein PACTADRAFT_49641 [Pachysolen tannophilus NRRL Y-2460]
MKLTKAIQVFVLGWSFNLRTVLGAAVYQNVAGAILEKRETTSSSTTETSVTTSTLTDQVWTTTTSSTALTITPYAFDGVTVSASPVDNATTVWASLDSSGIPYDITPTVTDGTTTSTSPTPTNTNYPTPIAQPPVLRCMNERVPSYTNPICISNLTEMVAGETYWITWNPLYWNPYEETGDISLVQFQFKNFLDDDDSTYVALSDWISNDDGYYAFKAKSSYITDDNEGYLQIYLAPFVTDETVAHVMDTVTGPVIRVIESVDDASTTITRVPSDNEDSDSTTTSTSSSSSSSSSSSDSSDDSSTKTNKAKVIAPAVIVPVVVVAIALFFAWINRARIFKGNKKVDETTNKKFDNETLEKMRKERNMDNSDSEDTAERTEIRTAL